MTKMRTLNVLWMFLIIQQVFVIIMKDIHNMNYNQIHFRAEFAIQEGRMDGFNRLVREMSKTVQDNEPGTITYEFYLSKDNTKCIVHKTYANSEAVFAHSNGIASKTVLPKIFEIAKMNRFDAYGNLGEELQEHLANFGSQFYNLYTGFSR